MPNNLEQSNDNETTSGLVFDEETIEFVDFLLNIGNESERFQEFDEQIISISLGTWDGYGADWELNFEDSDLNDKDIERLFNVLKSKPEIARGIESLILFGNNITRCPDLSVLPNLKFLHLSNNKLTLPPDVSMLENLERLGVFNNLFTVFPDISMCPEARYDLSMQGENLTNASQVFFGILYLYEPGIMDESPASDDDIHTWKEQALEMDDLVQHFKQEVSLFFSSDEYKNYLKKYYEKYVELNLYKEGCRECSTIILDFMFGIKNKFKERIDYSMNLFNSIVESAKSEIDLQQEIDLLAEYANIHEELMKRAYAYIDKTLLNIQRRARDKINATLNSGTTTTNVNIEFSSITTSVHEDSSRPSKRLKIA